AVRGAARPAAVRASASRRDRERRLRRVVAPGVARRARSAPARRHPAEIVARLPRAAARPPVARAGEPTPHVIPRRAVTSFCVLRPRPSPACLSALAAAAVTAACGGSSGPSPPPPPPPPGDVTPPAQNVLYVDARSGRDSNDGRTPSTAFATLNQAAA